MPLKSCVDAAFKLEDKMNFLDKVSYNGKRYIHESRVPISCGGTMEDTNDWCRSCFVQNPCGNAIKRRDEAVIDGTILSQVAKWLAATAPQQIHEAFLKEFKVGEAVLEIPDVCYPCHTCGIRKYGMCVDCQYNEEENHELE
jgi:hypothetical protein